jgi:hypothetical protein
MLIEKVGGGGSTEAVLRPMLGFCQNHQSLKSGDPAGKLWWIASNSPQQPQIPTRCKLGGTAGRADEAHGCRPDGELDAGPAREAANLRQRERLKEYISLAPFPASFFFLYWHCT